MQKRSQLIYGNCKVLSPDGELMFRCLEKKVNWYLTRNLAEVVDNDPLTIQLNFVPKGKGDSSEFLKEERENKCVVCENDDLEQLTKHHLIPYEFRRHFPKDLKNHNSAYIVPICKSCHDHYEKTFADVLKKELAKKYNAQFNPKDETNKQKKRIEKALSALLRHKDNMPEDRIQELREELEQLMRLEGVIPTKNELQEEEALENYLEFFRSNNENDEKQRGQIVVANCENLTEFSNIWVRNFIDNMKPKQMREFMESLIS